MMSSVEVINIEIIFFIASSIFFPAQYFPRRKFQTARNNLQVDR